MKSTEHPSSARSGQPGDDRLALRERLYRDYASHHAGRDHAESVGLVYRCQVRPALPPIPAGPIIDIGCGQGELVRLMLADGYDAEGIDVSPEQVAIARAGGVRRVREADYREVLLARPGHYAAITATDLLEHLSKPEVLDTFDAVVAGLAPRGAFIARVPNAASPLSGHIRYGDFTHETSFTAGSVRQLAAAAGFSSVAVLPCNPLPHGVLSAARLAVWATVSGCYRLALAAETGTFHGHVVTQNLMFVARKQG